MSLAPGGRLDTLLGAAEFASSPDTIDPSAGVDRTLCLAVDPDLLVTVNAMTAGYVVADSPTDSVPRLYPGSGQGNGGLAGPAAHRGEAAVRDGNRMRRPTSRHCSASRTAD